MNHADVSNWGDRLRTKSTNVASWSEFTVHLLTALRTVWPAYSQDVRGPEKVEGRQLSGAVTV